jgi:uncharacterized protein (TIGR03435 family)
MGGKSPRADSACGGAKTFLDPMRHVLLAPRHAFGAIFTAVQEQLGLRLGTRRGTRGVLVTDRVERPSAN